LIKAANLIAAPYNWVLTNHDSLGLLTIILRAYSVISGAYTSIKEFTPIPLSTSDRLKQNKLRHFSDMDVEAGKGQDLLLIILNYILKYIFSLFPDLFIPSLLCVVVFTKFLSDLEFLRVMKRLGSHQHRGFVRSFADLHSSMDVAIAPPPTLGSDRPLAAAVKH